MGDNQIPWDPLKFLFMMDEAVQEQIFYEYAFYFRRKGLLSETIHYVNESLKHSQRPKKPIYPTEGEKFKEDALDAAQHQYLERSRAELEKSHPKRAIDTMLTGLANDASNPIYKYQHMLAVHQNRQIEEAYKLAFNQLDHSTYHEKINLNHLIDHIKHNINHAIGDSAGACLINQLAIIKKFQTLRAEIIIDDRPRWKQLLEAGKCDADSLGHEIEKIPSPLEVMRKKHRHVVLNSRYFGVAAQDVNFLINLETDKRIISSPKPDSTAKLHNIIKNTNKKLLCYRDFLEVQQPLYSILHLQYRNSEDMEKAKKQNLILLQYKAFRDTMTHLDKIHARRYNVAKLTTFINDIIHNFYTIKTRRVLPRKFEIMSEIFNIYAMSELTTLRVPEGIGEMTPFRALVKTLDPDYMFEEDIVVDQSDPPFGQRSNRKDPNLPDPFFMNRVKKLSKTSNRLLFALYPVERCYLTLEMAKTNFELLKLDEARNCANRVISIHSEECLNWPYKFLAFIIGFKVCVIRFAFFEFEKYFEMGEKIVEHLDEHTQKYFELIRSLADLLLLDYMSNKSSSKSSTY